MGTFAHFRAALILVTSVVDESSRLSSESVKPSRERPLRFADPTNTAVSSTTHSLEWMYGRAALILPWPIRGIQMLALGCATRGARQVTVIQRVSLLKGSMVRPLARASAKSLVRLAGSVAATYCSRRLGRSLRCPISSE